MSFVEAMQASITAGETEDQAVARMRSMFTKKNMSKKRLRAMYQELKYPRVLSDFDIRHYEKDSK